MRTADGADTGTATLSERSALGRPPTRPAEIERTELLARQPNNRDRRVVLITAPAGYGKSILAAQWSSIDQQRAVSWVNLSDAHDDPVVLLGDVLAAVPGPIQLAPLQIRALLGAAFDGTPLSDADVTAGPSGVFDAVGPFTLVFDDAHRVQNPRSIQLLGRLIDAVPPGSQTVLASRTEPAIGVARRRANGELLEIRADDLAMDLAATTAYLDAAQVHLGAELVADLHHRTEGWPAGIGLAATAHRMHLDTVTPAPVSTWGHRDIGDYLFEEVLAHQDPALSRFLLETSVLSRFSSSLCDAMLDRTGSAEVIRQLERTNLFIIPLDDQRGWFRYHHLFQEHLADELGRTDPGARHRLLPRAAAWHRAHGTVEEALRYAQDGGDNALAGALVLAHWQDHGTQGQIETLRAWVARSTDEDICSDPAFAIGAAWVHLMLGDGERAERFAAAAGSFDLDVPSPDGATSLRSALANLRSGLGTAGVDQMLADGLYVRASERPTRTRWLHGGCRAVGTANLLLGRLDEAIVALDEALLLTENRPDRRPLRIFSLGYQALALLDHDEPARAGALVDEALELMGDAVILQTFQALPARTAWVAVLARSDRRGDALAALADTVADLGVTTAAPWMLAYLSLRNAESAQALGELAVAAELLDQAKRAIARLPSAGTMPARLESLAARNRRDEGLVEALTPAERRVLRQLATHRTLSEIGDELFISRSTVKTHVKSIYLKLDVSTRAEAVARLDG